MAFLPRRTQPAGSSRGTNDGERGILTRKLAAELGVARLQRLMPDYISLQRFLEPYLVLGVEELRNNEGFLLCVRSGCFFNFLRFGRDGVHGGVDGFG